MRSGQVVLNSPAEWPEGRLLVAEEPAMSKEE